MGENIKRSENIILREIVYISAATAALSVVLTAVLIVFGVEPAYAASGALVGALTAVGNFILTANTVTMALSTAKPQTARIIVFISYVLRMILIGFVIYIGFTAGNIDAWGVMLPLFFPKIAIMAQTFFRKGGKNWKARK